ncbi:stem 28 kDa glycoprotein-like [Abrus precatorius]|uniref:Stem 28 kDa glycoprotein-like n=1 Tax=Abrus precatorius TaxID=3816 RepID=A0A8B8JTX0_ABRPR|nr:stem 28 kDa glycoprotein-like [Abrus precatorius]
MGTKVVFCFLATVIATCHGLEHGTTHQVFPLRTKSGSGGHYIPNLTCSSWRVGVEAHNIIQWKTIPQECEGYIGNYILGDQYRSDSKTVCREAYFYAKGLSFERHDKNIWVFDIDETSLSNLPYYARHGFGVEPFNETSFNEWVELGIAPALPESLKLYNRLLSLGINVVFLTGRPVDQKDVTVKNLKLVGYHTWEKLIFKDPSYFGKTAVTYKSDERKKLETQGYKIIGNIGDQWSDILGTNTGNRTFKLPDPMYYIS